MVKASIGDLLKVHSLDQNDNLQERMNQSVLNMHDRFDKIITLRLKSELFAQGYVFEDDKSLFDFVKENVVMKHLYKGNIKYSQIYFNNSLVFTYSEKIEFEEQDDKYSANAFLKILD